MQRDSRQKGSDAGAAPAGNRTRGAQSVAVARKKARKKVARKKKVANKTPSSTARRGVTRKSDSQRTGKSSGRTGVLSKSLASLPRERIPAFISPQLATRVTEAPDGDGWLHEIKYDGYRLLARKDGPKVTLVSRNGHDWTAKAPQLVAEIEKLAVETAWFDGELTALNADGTTSFQKLQNVFKGTNDVLVRYYAFDLLHLDGVSLRSAPLHVRKEMLKRVLGSRRRAVLYYSDHQLGGGAAFYREAAALTNIEGIISKDVDAPYLSKRTKSWLKVKCGERQDFVVGGVSPLRGKDPEIGALLVGVYDDSETLQYCGKVGTGFSATDRVALFKLLSRSSVQKCPFAEPVRERGAIWIRPKHVAEISFQEWTNDGRLRHPVFHGLREDLPASAVHRERPMDVSEPSPTPKKGGRSRTH